MKNFLSKISISKLLFSVIFSFALFYMSKIVFLGMVYDENYMDLVFFSEFKILFILVPIVYLITYLIEKQYKKMYPYIIEKNQIINKKLFCISAFIFLLTIYFICYLTFFPGGVYIDTWTSLEMLTGEEDFTNQQPVFYTFLLNIVKAFLPNLYMGFGVFTLIQSLCMVLCLTYFVYWLLNKNVNHIVVAFITIFLGLFRLYPLYSVSVWKDTPFNLVLFLYTLSLIDLIIDFKNKNIKISNIIKFNIWALLAMLLRNNGIYISFATLIILLITIIINTIKKEKIIRSKLFLVISFITIAIFVFIQNLYQYWGFENSPFVESLAIPIQQIARVVATDGNITTEQMELIEKVLPKEIIKEKYRALIVDGIKWDSNFNEEYLENHKSEYFKLWFELLLQNPGEYIRAYLLQTSGFWTFNVRGEEAYYSPIIWETLNDKIKNFDVIGQNKVISFRNDFLSLPYYSGGLFFWITCISILITFGICKKTSLLGYLPPILLWLTVMISTPMGQALRYVYILVLIIPLNVVYPAIMKNIEESDK